MKQFIAVMLLSLLAAPGCTFSSQPKAMVTLHVVNQDGKPVSDTEMVATFENGKEDIVKRPDKNGYVTFTSPALGTAIFRNKQDLTWDSSDAPNKYYHTFLTKKYYIDNNTKDGKWQPWNPIIKFVLCERINPIPMYANGRQNDMTIPTRNEWVGLDMMKNAWVRPHGEGTHADVEIFHAWDGQSREKYTGSTLKIRFPDRDAGCYEFNYEHREQFDDLRFKSPYHANPTSHYNKNLIFYEKYNSSTKKWESKPFPNGTGYIFRTRTRFDEHGQMIGAYYGKIYQPIASLFYLWHGDCLLRLPFYLNPTENDTNLECDPERNLLRKYPRKRYVEP